MFVPVRGASLTADVLSTGLHALPAVTGQLVLDFGEHSLLLLSLPRAAVIIVSAHDSCVCSSNSVSDLKDMPQAGRSQESRHTALHK